MFHPPFTPHVSLCSGYEGIGLGLRNVLPGLRTVAYCEREGYAIANLEEKIEKGLLDAAPLYHDVATFPYADFYPLMGATPSLCTFGFPCQPHSCAGKRKGAADERWLFDCIADGLALMRPAQIFIENVPGLLSSRMPTGQLCIDYIFARLAGIGYQMADRQGRPLIGIFSASEVGAPHQRKRIFILGQLDDARSSKPNGLSNGPREESAQTGEASELDNSKSRWRENKEIFPRRNGVISSSSERMADPIGSPSQTGSERAGWEERPNTERSSTGADVGNPASDNQRRDSMPGEHGERIETGRSSSDMGDTTSARRKREGEDTGTSHGHAPEKQSGSQEPQRTSELAQPGRSRCERGERGERGESHGNEGKTASKSITECSPLRWPARPGQPQHDWEAPRLVESRLGGTINEHAIRVDRLRLLGNGCVPATVELAYRTLIDRLNS